MIVKKYSEVLIPVGYFYIVITKGKFKWIRFTSSKYYYFGLIQIDLKFPLFTVTSK